jgi:hypothetical protein
MSTLNTDCVRIIVGYLYIADVVNACLALSDRHNAKYLIDERLSPIKLFSKLVPEPEELLYAMCASNCVLGGSRALNYFYPGSCNKDSDWDFYMQQPKRKDYLQPDMKTALQDMGVQWLEQEEHEYEHLSFEVLRGVMYTGRRKFHHVQLIWPLRRDVISSIIEFHSTPVQCFVAHFGAFHLYGKVTQSDRQIVWYGNIQKRRNEIHEFNEEKCEHARAMIRLGHEAAISILHNPSMEVPEKTSREVLDEALDYVDGMVGLYMEQSLKWQSWKPTDSEHPEGWYPKDEIMRSNDFRNYVFCRVTNRYGAVRELVVRSFNDIIHALGMEECVCIGDFEFEKIEKYKERGYKELGIYRYQLETEGWTKENSEVEYRVRCIGDSESTIIPFYGYGPCPFRSSIRSQVSKLAKFKWLQFADIPTTVGMFSYLEAVKNLQHARALGRDTSVFEGHIRNTLEWAFEYTRLSV